MDLSKEQIEEIQKVYLACKKYGETCKATGYNFFVVKKCVDLIQLDEKGELSFSQIPEYDISILRKKVEAANLQDYSSKVFLLTKEELEELTNFKKVL